jgi:hypothetical protein
MYCYCVLQEWLNINFQAGTRHGELKLCNDVRVQDSNFSNFFPIVHHRGASFWEERGVWKKSYTKILI